MKTTIGIYDNHELALNAVIELKNSGFHVKHISILGKAKKEVLDDDMNIIAESPLNLGGVAVGTVAGTTAGALAGLGLLAVPGLGILMGTGALIGAIAGFEFGLIGGGLASVLMSLGLHKDSAKAYQQYLDEDKFLLMLNGSHEELEKAHDILVNHGTHMDIAAHDLAEKVNLQIAKEKEKAHAEFMSRLDSQFPLSGGERD